MSRDDARWFRALLRLFPSEFRGDFGRQMLEDFRPGGLDDADSRYLHSDLLILDDLTMVKTNTEWAIEQIYRVIDDRRRNCRVTILTSNEPPHRLKELLNEQIVSRIVERCAVIVLNGVDRRRAPKSEQEARR